MMLAVWILGSTFVFSENSLDIYVEGKVNQGKAYAINYPMNVDVKKADLIMDFDIYSFYYNQEVFLYAYVGNFPSLKMAEQKKAKLDIRYFNGLKHRALTVKNDDKTQSQEVLVYLVSDLPWPMFIHFWYNDLSDDLTKIATEIIESTSATFKLPKSSYVIQTISNTWTNTGRLIQDLLNKLTSSNSTPIQY